MKTSYKINSYESSYENIIILGVIFLLCFIPAAVVISRAGVGIFAVLLLPLIGIGTLVGGLKMRKKFLIFGKTPLTLPKIGQVGGQVAGIIELQEYFSRNDLTVTLSCIRKIEKRTSTYGNNFGPVVLWQAQNTPLYSQVSNGSKIEFCFDVPAGQYTADNYNHKGLGTIHWEVMVEGLMNDMKFKRIWEIPVEKK